ncbi:MAG: 50S ribosomal protein L6 [Nitrospirales bacterium]|nr:50S ribosomal protein L6 [Nitrospirales bacterium]
MSRIGKKPIDIPQGVNIDLSGDVIKVKGPKGELTYNFPEGISITAAEGKLTLERNSDEKSVRALHGLARSLVSNMVGGVSQGFTRVLEIKGVGFRAQAKGSKLSFSLGYSHPVEFDLPNGISATVDDKQTTITLSGIDNQLIGQVAANIRKLRSPDAYKGKGIRFAGQVLKLKAGKTGKK